MNNSLYGNELKFFIYLNFCFHIVREIMAERTESQRRLKKLRKEEKIAFKPIHSEIKKMFEHKIDPFDFIKVHIYSYKKRRMIKKKLLKSSSDKCQRKILRQEILVLNDCITVLEVERMKAHNKRRNKTPNLDGIERRKEFDKKEKEKNRNKPEKFYITSDA